MKYPLLIISILASVAAQVIIKGSSLHAIYSRKWVVTFTLSIICYGIAFLLQAFLVRHFPLTKIGPSMAISIMILVFLAGLLFFGESAQPKQIAGLILGILATYLILS